MIKSLPIEENPREKAYLYGIDHLSNIELLALLLRTGNKNESVLELSARLLKEIDGINHLKDVDLNTLTSLKGIKKAKAITLLAAIELNKRLNEPVSQVVFDNARHIYDYMSPQMKDLKQEHFVVLILDNHHQLLRQKTLFIGTINMSVVSTREIYQEALNANGVAIVVVHNHPSGICTPSQEDINLTEELKLAGQMIGIKLLDHIIIGNHQYYSFMAQKVCQ